MNMCRDDEMTQRQSRSPQRHGPGGDWGRGWHLRQARLSVGAVAAALAGVAVPRALPDLAVENLGVLGAIERVAAEKVVALFIRAEHRQGRASDCAGGRRCDCLGRRRSSLAHKAGLSIGAVAAALAGVAIPRALLDLAVEFFGEPWAFLGAAADKVVALFIRAEHRQRRAWHCAGRWQW